MKEIQEIASLVTGSCGLCTLNGYTLPTRFTAGQLDFYAGRNETDFTRSRSPAGIRLDFTTDAECISFDFLITGVPYVQASGLDVREDGVFTDHLTLSGRERDAVQHYAYTRRKKERSRLTIDLPHGMIFIPFHFELGDALPVKQPDKLALFYGDSIAHSAYISTPSVSWTGMTAEALHARELNRGIGSFFFCKDSLPDEADCRPDYLFVEYGFNDLGLFDAETRLINAEAYLTRLQELYPGAATWVITTDFGQGAAKTPEAWEKRAAYCDEIEKLAYAHGMRVLRGEKLVPTLPVFFVSDFVHLSEAGSGVFAHNIVKYMEE